MSLIMVTWKINTVKTQDYYSLYEDFSKDKEMLNQSIMIIQTN